MDLTKITTPFGLLDDETREALKAHGGPYEYANDLTNWRFLPILGASPRGESGTVYRVKPQPPKPREAWLRINHNGEIRECSEDAEGASLWREVPK